MAGHAGAMATRRGTGWRACAARFLAAAVLLMSIIAHPSPEHVAGAGFEPVAVTAVAADTAGGAGIPARQDGIVHAGAHCSCHMTDRLDPPGHAAPAAFGAVAHPERAAREFASRGAEPPARPPRA